MDVKIEKLVYGGEGLGHHEGHTVFVPFVLPEEVVSVEATDRRKKFVRGRVQQLVTPSPQRATPPCPHFAICGGCHYQHIPYDAQLKYKTEILRETLSRLGRVTWEGAITAHPSPPFSYRNRAQWKIRPGGDSSPVTIGYFQAGSTKLCAVDECPILSPRLAEALAALRGLLAGGKLPTIPREIEAFADSSDRALLLNASFERFGAEPAALAQAFRVALPNVETILLQETGRDRLELIGPGYIHYNCGGKSYRVGHLSFFQVNRFLVDDLVRAVAEQEQGRLALDLFAGVGLFTLPLAERFERVVAVESNPAAARDLSANIEEGRARAEHSGAEAEAFLAGWREAPDLVVLDPPRAGVPSAALERIVELAPARITYLSCDPATLARDLAALTGAAGKEGRYEIVELHLFDVFPQTYHIESLVRLRRRE